VTDPNLVNPAEPLAASVPNTRLRTAVMLGCAATMLGGLAFAAGTVMRDPALEPIAAHDTVQPPTPAADCPTEAKRSALEHEGVGKLEAPSSSPTFTVDKKAVSVGKPNDGRLVDGLQLPASPQYVRRTAHAMWGSGLTIASLQQAIVSFRRDTDYTGALVLSDISLRGGGVFSPHRSHQTGRDVDIWLPTREGVFKPEHLDSGGNKPRRPMFDEIDWDATWGLLRALIQTGAVEFVFLDSRHQQHVVQAAVSMGATQEELDAWFQWPRSPTSTVGIVRHSAAHLSHVHVRFKCAAWELECGSEPKRKKE